jgi:transcriptional regulator with XRE-family HTH domain
MTDFADRKHEANPRDRALWGHIGKRMRMRRTQLGLDCDHVADQLAIPKQTYEQYESGSLQTPALVLGDIAQLFDLPVTWFFQELSVGDAQEEVGAGEQAVLSVATDEERAETLTDYFRNLDLERQQHLLSIARTLYRTSKGLDSD